MDSSAVAERQSPSSAASPSPRPSTKRSKRQYRTKPRDDDSDDGNEQECVPAHEQSLSSSSAASSTLNAAAAATATAVESNLLYVQSQNAQNIAEVYPGLARLSFLNQEQATDEQDMDNGASLLSSKTRRPLQQKPQPVSMSQAGSAVSPRPDGSMTKPWQDQIPKSSVPPASSPSALSAGTKTGASLVEIKETGLIGKGRGVFSSAAEVLKPGTLVFKELGFCQVVNDASLSLVCSACFKDTREEQGDDEKSAGGISASGQRKLVRCAGCKVVWYCNKACQVKDWKLHHQMECQGIQKSMADPVMKDVWTKRAMDTTTVRALCRLVRRRERVRKSAAFKTEHGKDDAAQKQVNEVYFSGLDQKEEEWLDENGSTWIERYLQAEENERPSTTFDGSSKADLQHSSQLAKIMAIVTSCVVTPKEDRQTFLKGGDSALEGATEMGGFSLLRTLMSYGFSITNLETTSEVGLSLYVQCMPFMNHSCVPNCVYTFKGSRVECRVIRDVQPSEELTISYIDQIGTTRERQRQLQEQYHFTCDCPLCKFFPANPMVQPDVAPLKSIAPDLPFSPVLDPKQGLVCRNLDCASVSEQKPILAIESQLAIYNKVDLKCQRCGSNAELTQELLEENQEEVSRLRMAFIREMNSGTAPQGGSRSFELAKAVIPQSASAESGDTADKPAVLGGLTTVEEPSASALQYFDKAYKALTASLPPHARSMAPAVVREDGDLIPRSDLHQLTRQLVQTAFDEAVSHKNWSFALSQSIQLEHILKNTYVGHHPLKAIQGYYTCKIANLLANLLLEESTVEIEGDQGVKDADDDMATGNSDDEHDLNALRDAMGDGGRARAASSVGSGSLQEQLLRGKRKETGHEELVRDSDVKQRKKTAQESIGSKRLQARSSQEVMQRLKSLIPTLEDPSILQQFKVCWGKDGKLASRYRSQVDSLKQALHYAELPFSKN